MVAGHVSVFGQWVTLTHGVWLRRRRRQHLANARRRRRRARGRRKHSGKAFLTSGSPEVGVLSVCLVPGLPQLPKGIVGECDRTLRPAVAQQWTSKASASPTDCPRPPKGGCGSKHSGKAFQTSGSSAVGVQGVCLTPGLPTVAEGIRAKAWRQEFDIIGSSDLGMYLFLFYMQW